MTNRTLQKIISEIIPELTGTVLKMPMVVYCPLIEILRGFYFEQSGSDVGKFYVWAFFMPLCVPSKHVGLNLGRRLGGARQRWDLGQPDLKGELLFTIKQEGIPFLSRVQTAPDAAKMAKIFSHSAKSPYAQQAAAYLLARTGEINDAIEALEELLKGLNADAGWQAELALRAKTLQTLLLEDPASADEQLKHWETETIKELGLERICERILR